MEKYNPLDYKTRDEKSKIKRFEWFKEYIIGKNMQGLKVIDITHDYQFSMNNLNISIYFENGTIVNTKFFLAGYKIKIYGNNSDTLFEGNMNEIFKELSQK